MIRSGALRSKINEVFASKNSFAADPLSYTGLGVAALLNIIHWLILFSKIKPSKTQILLHYNVVTGPDLVSQSAYIYWIPLLALVLLIINVSIAAFFYKKEKLAAYFMVFSSIAVQMIFLVASIALIVANG